MLKDFFVIALSSLKKRRLRSLLTMIGIFIGIAAIISLIGLGEGLRNAINSLFGNLGVDTLTVQAGGVQAGPPGTGVIKELTKDDAEKIGKLAGVKESIPRLIRSGRMEFNDKQLITYIGSMVDGDARKEIERVVNIEIDEGRLLKDGDKYRVVVGGNYKNDDKFSKPISTGTRIKVEGKIFEVIGIAKKKGNPILDNVILMNEDIMRDLFNDQKKVDIIAVIVKDKNEISNVKLDIEKLLRKQRDVKEGEEDFSVETPQNAIKTLNDTLFAVQLFVYIIAGISLLVGGIGITNTMYTSVIERTKDIGIMKSIGARNKDIFLIFLIESGFLGMVGGIIGISIGIIAAKSLAYVGGLILSSNLIQASFSPLLIIGSLIFSFMMGTAAGLTPAVQASKLKPVDALRYK